MSYLQKLIKLSDVFGDVGLLIRITQSYKDNVRTFLINDFKKSGLYEIAKLQDKTIEVKYSFNHFEIHTGNYDCDDYGDEVFVCRYTTSDVKAGIVNEITFEDEEQLKEDLAELILRFGRYREFKDLHYFPHHMRTKILEAQRKVLHDELKHYGIEFIHNNDVLTDDEMVVKDILE